VVLKRILFFLPQLKQGGAERVVLNLIKGLDRSQFIPCLAWFHGQALYPFSELKGIPMFKLNKREGFDLRTMVAIVKIVQRESIDLINPHHFMPLFYAFPACKLTKIKIVYTEHSVWEAAQVKGMWEIISKFLMSKTDSIVGVSPEISAFLKNKYALPQHRVRAIINGIDTQIFSPAPRNNRFRRTMGLEESHIAIGMTGNFRKVKNHHLLINAFARITAQFPNARLVLIGQGFSGDPENTEKDIHSLVRKYNIGDKVHFVGYRNDVHTILPCLDIFCLTSHKEGLPLSLIEAMACGLPVVGTDVEGIRVVIESGRNGFLVENHDSGDLARVLSILIADRPLRERMGKEGRKDAERYYSLTRFSRQYNQLFASLV